MIFYSHLSILILSVIIIHICLNIEFIWISNIIPDPLPCLIGILSARENFDLRQAVRSTWLKQTFYDKNYSFKAWFIIGKDDCKIPPEYRLSKYGCEKWNISSSGIASQFYTSHKVQSKICPPNQKEVFRQGFSFKVNHPLLVVKLGILQNLLIPAIDAKIAILDIQTKEIVVQAVVSQNSSDLAEGYMYEDVETILLPKDYEGMVLIEGYLQYDACAKTVWNDGGGVITFNRIYSSPSHLDSIKFSNEVHSAASIYFLTHELNVLKKLMTEEERITSDWLAHLQTINTQLVNESSENQDILFVNVTDTYRNLPTKLLHFYKWIDTKFEYSYVMKADDDTIVDIFKLYKVLKSHEMFNPGRHWLWSWFRNDWPVNYIGKWADYDYRASVYPSFPCGATYVMSRKTLKWLSLNAENLYPYQGEDVSMGIWLSAIKADLINDKHFQCDSSCSKDSYNRAQLSSKDIYDAWSVYQTCQNLCSCS